MTRETVGDLRRWAENTLRRARVDTPALDARVLLLHATGLDHATLIAAPETLAEADAFRAAIARRAAREPVSRILGEREFYGLTFRVTPAVLDPRPDTETLIAAALALPWQRVLDLGTGSGCIAVTLLHARPEATGLATDLSAEALAIAQYNARRHGVADRLAFAQGSWFAPVEGRFDLIVSNPPYIAAGDIPHLAPEVRAHDPWPSLDGGHDGLDCYRAIAEGLSLHLTPGGQALLEIGLGQANAVSAILAAHSHAPTALHPDLSGHPRVLRAG